MDGRRLDKFVDMVGHTGFISAIYCILWSIVVIVAIVYELQRMALPESVQELARCNMWKIPKHQLLVRGDFLVLLLCCRPRHVSVK